MTERTYNIIMACKSNEKYSNVVDAAKAYMAFECGCPFQHYTERDMNNIMFAAMCDYIDSCDKPSSFLYAMHDIFCKEYLSLGEKIARAFQLVRVRDNDKYINGFGEWAKDED